MSALWNVQQAIFSALNGVISRAVYSVGNVPDNTEGVYAVIGEATSAAHDADAQTGFEVTAVVHSWDSDPNSRGTKNVDLLMGEVYDVLNRANLAVTGYTLLDCFFEFEQAMIDPDGLTAHGVQRFRVLLTAN